MLAANAAFSYRAIRHLAQDQEWVVHSQEVKWELQAALMLVTDAETSHRGYLLTGNPAFLDAYEREVGQISGHIDRVEELSRNNFFMHSQVPALRQRVEQKLEMDQASIHLAQQGKQNRARSAWANGASKQSMDQIRQMVREMLSQENNLLAARTRAAHESLRAAVLTSALASLVAVIFAIAFYVAAKREVFQRVNQARFVEEREAWLNTTLSSIGDAVIATDPHGIIKFINRAAERLISCSNEECGGRPIAEVFRIFDERDGAAVPNPVERVLREGRTSFGERILLHTPEGGAIPIESSAAPILGSQGATIGVVLVFRDVSARRMAQESARRSEKLAATGRLAATIAHEINNPLEAATNFIYLARNSPTLEDSQRYLAGADLELARAAHITRKALSFYRDSARPVVTNVASLLDEILSIYGGRIRASRANVAVDCPPDVELITLRGELIQIISNLISNALDAMRPGGLLTIRAGKAERGINLEIQDTGEGIPEANMGKIFEAFFTTKKDIGTGLGLWVVNDLVQKQGGAINVVSHTEGPNRGTTFSLFLPSLPVPIAVPEKKAS